MWCNRNKTLCRATSSRNSSILKHCLDLVNNGSCSRHWQIFIVHECCPYMSFWPFSYWPRSSDTLHEEFSYFALIGAELLWKASGFVTSSGSVWITAAGWKSRQDLSALRHLAYLWLIFLLSHKHFIQTKASCTAYKISIVEPDH